MEANLRVDPPSPYIWITNRKQVWTVGDLFDIPNNAKLVGNDWGEVYAEWCESAPNTAYDEQLKAYLAFIGQE